MTHGTQGDGAGPGTLLARAAALGRAVAREAGLALVPLECAGCGAFDRVLCPDCHRCLAAPSRVDRDADELADGLAVWGLGAYREALRHVVLAWKVGGRRDLDPVLADALGAVVDAWWAADDGWGVGRGATVWVVPAPSGRLRALRGRPPVWHLAEAVAAGLARHGCEARVVLALGQRGSARHHSGAGRRRQGATRAAVTARVHMVDARVVLVDDVLTTGATLQRCRAAVLGAGGDVLGAVVLAAAATPGGHVLLSSRRHVD